MKYLLKSLLQISGMDVYSINRKSNITVIFDSNFLFTSHLLINRMEKSKNIFVSDFSVKTVENIRILVDTAKIIFVTKCRTKTMLRKGKPTVYIADNFTTDKSLIYLLTHTYGTGYNTKKPPLDNNLREYLLDNDIGYIIVYAVRKHGGYVKSLIESIK